MLCFFIAVIFLQESYYFPKNIAKMGGKGLLDAVEILKCLNACWGSFTTCFLEITIPKEEPKCIHDRKRERNNMSLHCHKV